jgi:1-deoxy-D-xylulose-5-phosphate reductoisomerase
MRLPIGYALGYPRRIGTPFGRIDWGNLGSLTFEPPDLATFRCLSLAYDAGRMGGVAPAWVSAANEVAVDAFHDGRLGFPDIVSTVAHVLERHDVPSKEHLTVDDVLAADSWARAEAAALI